MSTEFCSCKEPIIFVGQLFSDERCGRCYKPINRGGNMDGMQHAHEQTITGIIQKYAEEFDIDPALAIDIAMAESSLDPKAMGKAGEVGLFQLHPKYVDAFALQAGYPQEEIDQKFVDYLDPDINAKIALKQLATLKEQLGDRFSPATLIAANNWGIDNLKKNDYQIPDFLQQHPNEIYRKYLQPEEE